MATLSRQPIELSTPIQRPPSPSYLAFVLYDDLWWPAAVYQHYSQAMRERHDELPCKIKNMLLRKMLTTQDQGKIAQVLGYNHLWIEVQEQKSIYLHLPQVQLEYTVERLGREKYNTYQRALDEAMEIMEREEYLSPPSKQNLSERFPEEQGTTTITPRNSGSKIVTSNKKRKREDRIWGSEKHKEKAQKPSPRPVSSPDTEPRRHYRKKNIPEKKKRTPAKRSQRKSSQFFLRPKLSPDSDHSRKNFYVWNRYWHILVKKYGWRVVKAKNPLTDWWYVRPSVVDLKNAIAGKDYFESKDDVIAWGEKEQIREQLYGLTDESSVDTRVSRRSTDDEEDEEESQFPCSSDDDNSTIASSVQQSPRRTLTFAKAWSYLSNEGKWRIECVEGKTLFVRPGKCPSRDVEGEDFFGSAPELIEWLYATGEANQMLNEDDALSLGAQAEHYSEAEDTNSSGEDDDFSQGKQRSKGASRRVTMSPVASKSGRGRKSKSKETVSKKHAVQKKMKNSTQKKILPKDKTERTPKEKNERKAASFKKKIEWFHEDEVPPFASGSDSVWNILRDKFQFRYVGGKYALPLEFAKLSDCPDSFTLDLDLRKFLCKNGIPNYDESKLSVEERTNLQRWLAFANVPVTSHNSIYKLREVNVLAEEGAKELLKEIGFDEVHTSFYYVYTDKTYASLEDVRTYIRSLSDLVPSKEEGASQRSNRNKQHKLPLDDDQVLHLRVWAAMSELPLPKFNLYGA